MFPKLNSTNVKTEITSKPINSEKLYTKISLTKSLLIFTKNNEDINVAKTNITEL